MNFYLFILFICLFVKKETQRETLSILNHRLRIPCYSDISKNVSGSRRVKYTIY